jgi:hypothetical protein
MTTNTANRILIASLALTCGTAAVAAESAGNYAADLGRVYGAYQRMLAMKEACDTAVPGTRSANGKAFAAWQDRHRMLVQDLERRVTVMIRLASKDAQEYVRNVGKYQGSILLERQEYRDMLIGLGVGELREQCERMPDRLMGPEADLGKVYAVELETIRKHH